MDKTYPLSTLIIVPFLDPKNDPVYRKKGDEYIFGPEIPYLNAIGAMMYLAQCIRPNIAFSVNLLGLFNFKSIRRH